MKTANRMSGSATARWRQTIGAAALALATGWAAISQATVTTVAWYKLGEDDPGATSNLLGQLTTIDSSGNGFNLTRRDFSGVSPTNRADVATESSMLGSTLSMQFTQPIGYPYIGSGYYYTNSPVTLAVSNVVVEAWVKPLAVNALGAGFVVRNGYYRGYSIYLNGSSNWVFNFDGIGSPFTIPATMGQWQHLAMVLIDDPTLGTFTDMLGYKNGVLLATSTGFFSPNLTPSNQFSIGMAGLGGTEYPFSGLIDNVRVSTFATGQFSPSDFLIPEPSAIALIAAASLGLGLAARRRSRTS